MQGILGGLRLLRRDRSGAMVCGFIVACLLYESYVVAAYLMSFSQGIFDSLDRPIGRDFVNYWSAGVAVFDSSVLQIFDIRLFHAYQEQLFERPFADHNWSYPPHMLLVVWPFGQLPYLWALAVWSLCWLGLYLWACVAGRRGNGWLLLLALLMAPATYQNFTGGQNGFLTGLLLIAGLRLLGPRPIVAGVLFGLLTVKPQLGILLPVALLAARQWHAIAAACVTTVVLIGVSVLWFGWESWQAYLELVVPFQTRLMNEGSGTFLTMMPSAYIGLRLLEVDPSVRWAVQGLLMLTAAGAVAWAFARSKDSDLTFAVLAVGTFLASPYSFNYDMTAVSLAVALLALRGLREGFFHGELVVLAAVWMLPTAVLWLNAAEVPIGPVILLSCLAYALLRIRRSLMQQGSRHLMWAKTAEAQQS